ncbi:outer membrane beta-barrel protein, partial [Xanthomonas citri pv. citri]
VNQTRWGYTIGIGVEWGFAENWSVGGEYNHVFLGHHSADFATLTGGFLARTDRIGQDIDMGLIRINYRWGGPLVAKY